MQITLNTAESSIDELTALIALLASLGGRLPDHAARPASIVDVVERRHAAIAASEGKVTDEQDEESGNFPSADDADRAVDSKGTPWDARIHSESKATVADGTWRKRRGVSDELFASVMAELTAADGIEQDDAPPPPPADEGNEDVPAPPAPTEDKPSEPEPAASAPAAGDPPTPAGGSQFADFPAFVAAVSKHGKTYVELNELAGMLGVPMFKDMKDHADKWDSFFAMVG